MSTRSYQSYDHMPSAIIADLPLFVPLWAVTAMSLTATYHLPPIGTTGARTSAASHDDSVTLDGVLVGDERYAMRAALETLAETGQRGGMASALAGLVGVRVTGLVLVTAMTIRTDMFVTSLAFSASASRRDALDVKIALQHVPPVGTIGKLIDLASIGVGALADLGGN